MHVEVAKEELSRRARARYCSLPGGEQVRALLKNAKEIERIQERLRSFQPLTHTFRVHEDRGITIVDDTYNSSRLSVRAALHWAAHRSERPRVLLLSELLETGAHEDLFLEELGKEAQGSVERIVIIDTKMKAALERGYESPVELLRRSSDKVPDGGLLLCIGRMRRASIEKLLP